MACGTECRRRRRECRSRRPRRRNARTRRGPPPRRRRRSDACRPYARRPQTWPQSPALLVSPVENEARASRREAARHRKSEPSEEPVTRVVSPVKSKSSSHRFVGSRRFVCRWNHRCNRRFRRRKTLLASRLDMLRLRSLRIGRRNRLERRRERLFDGLKLVVGRDCRRRNRRSRSSRNSCPTRIPALGLDEAIGEESPPARDSPSRACGWR